MITLDEIHGENSELDGNQLILNRFRNLRSNSEITLVVNSSDTTNILLFYD